MDVDMRAITDGASRMTTALSEFDALAIQVEQRPRSAMVPGFLGQLAAMKITRIQLIQLPDELLIHIAACLVRGAVPELPYPVFALTAVCTRLRALYLSTPELWTYIDLDWPPEAIQLSMRCASSQPLEIVVNNPSFDNGTLQCLSQAQTLRVELHTSERERIKGICQDPRPILKHLEETNLIKLHVIIIRGGDDHQWEILADNSLTAASCANLVAFAAKDIYIFDFPRLPVLRTLKIESCSLWLSALQEFLSRTPTLEQLELLGAMTTNMGPTVPHVPLPLLRDLIIKDCFEGVAMYIDMFPIPSNMLHVSAENDVVGLSDMPFHTVIMEHLMKFWEHRVGDRVPFPNGQLSRYTDVNTRQIFTEIIFGNTAWDSLMAYSWIFESLEPGSPVLDCVAEVRLEYTDKHSMVNLLAPSPKDLDLRLLRHFEKLVVVGTNNLDQHADAEVARSLEDWVVLRREVPIRTVEFWQCGEAVRGLFERLEQGVPPASVTWVS